MKGLLSLVCATAVALGLSATAHAGCMATVGLTPPPAAAAVGHPWVVTIRVLQHGVTPMPDARPVVRIRKSGSKPISFRGTKTGRVGSYRARVVFPSAGRYAISVYDGFPVRECARMHTVGAVVATDA